MSAPEALTEAAIGTDRWRVQLHAQRLLGGAGCLRELGAEAVALGASKVLVVSDHGIAAAGWVAEALGSLADAGLAATVFTEVCENPTERCVATGVEAVREANPDLLVGLGGGSAMDCAKGVNFVLAGGGRMEDYWGFGKARGELLPSIGVPCTAGTGSEAQSFALISRDRDHRKMACGDPRARFRTVLLDPRLATTAPRRVVALAGLDAFSHGIEAFVTRTAQPLSRLLAREGAAAINGALASVLRDQGDLAAWSSMLFGAYLSGAAIEASMLGAAHALANPLTAHYSLGHGEAVALVLPAVVRWNGGLDDGRAYTEIAAALGLLESGESPSEALARRASDLTAMAGLAPGLAVWGVEEAALPALAAEAAEQWTLRHNPRSATVEDLAGLYRASL